MKTFYKQNFESISFRKLVKNIFFLLLIMSLDLIYAKSLFTENYTNLEFSERKMKTVKKDFKNSERN